MRPYIICYMLASVDGKTDGAGLKGLTSAGEYESAGSLLNGDAWICGRTTRQRHFADPEPFIPTSCSPAGPQPVYVARRAPSYAIAVDTRGKLRWSSPNVEGDHPICVVSEQAPLEYLTMLRNNGISYVVAGEPTVDLAGAVSLLGKHFGIRRLLLEGGGHINGALKAGLVDELSLLIAPGIDGRHDIPAVFDGVSFGVRKAAPLRLGTVERRGKDTLWLRYDIRAEE